MKPFDTKAPEVVKFDGGYGSGPGCSPHELANKLFKQEVPGPWLCCYMLRRFGWPNGGSDDYKELMSWSLTTPINGLFLCVTPYLGSHPDPKLFDSTSNLHFAVRFSNDIGRKLDSDPGRDAYFRRRYGAIMRWWKRKGIKIYAWGCGLKDGDSDELVHKFCDHSKNKALVYGLWLRTPTVKGKRDIPKQVLMVEWWLEQLIKAKHLEIKLPKMTASERRNRRNPFAERCAVALQRTMLDLLRPTNVRDVDFNCFGKTEQGHAGAIEPKLIRGPHANYWPGAGNTPAYWYSDEGKKERAKPCLTK